MGYPDNMGPKVASPAETSALAAVRELLTAPAFRRRAVEGQPHLNAAVAALALAEAADRLARAEVMAARERDGATWEQVGSALGISRQSAHERFRTGPDGLHSRLFLKAARQKSEGSPGSDSAGGRKSSKDGSGGSGRVRGSVRR